MESVTQDVKTESTPIAEVKPQSVEQNVKQEVETIPYSRFAEKTKQNKELQERVASYEAEAEKTRQKELEKRGEYETLLTEERAKYEKVKAKADEFDNYINGRKDAILSTYSDDERDIVGELPLSKLEKYHENRNSNKKVGVDSSRGGTSLSSPKPFHEMTMEEKQDPATWRSYLETFRRK